MFVAPLVLYNAKKCTIDSLLSKFCNSRFSFRMVGAVYASSIQFYFKNLDVIECSHHHDI